jgi:hypothetical protein
MRIKYGSCLSPEFLPKKKEQSPETTLEQKAARKTP